ncbi:MAG: UDP-3-O-acyl-N-acetylglucosamine deacetylase [Candidatus Omnitrophica bacterium]|nr:UDP-3-O-acyl-N-acetylglucosamine deacetylase [Candidatus Omnitrophota bacterium]
MAVPIGRTKKIKQKILAGILAVLLLIDTVSWAVEAGRTDSLGPPTRINNATFIASATVRQICEYIERAAGQGAPLELEKIEKILTDIRRRFPDTVTCTVIPDREITIEIPREGLAVRCFDPGRAPVVTPYADIAELVTRRVGPDTHAGTVLLQLIRRTPALASPAHTISPVTLAERCEAMGQRLLIGEDINAAEFAGLFDELVEDVIPPDDMQTFKLILEFFADETRSHRVFDGKRLDAIMARLRQISWVRGVNGLGYPHYGDIDVRKRMFFTLLQLKKGEIRYSWHAIKRMMPDYDMLIIFKEDKAKTWRLHQDMDKEFNRCIQSIMQENDEYRAALGDLADVVSYVNVAYDRNNYQQYIREFLKTRKLVMDFWAPTPEKVWNNVPVFVADGDENFFAVIKDLWLTINGECRAGSLPYRYRRNLVLNIIRQEGALRPEDIVNRIAEKRIAKEHLAPVLDIYPEVRALFTRKWQAVIAEAVREGFIVRDQNGFISQTKKGELFIRAVLDWRSELLSRGEIGDASFDEDTALRTIDRDAAVRLERADGAYAVLEGPVDLPEGITFHTGSRTRVRISPTTRSGFRIKRIDIPGSPEINVSPEAVPREKAFYRTVLTNEEGIGAQTVEHLLSALMYGLNLRGADILIDGDEIPIYDGSPRTIVNAVRDSGLLANRSGRDDRMTITKPVVLTDPRRGVKIIALPPSAPGQLKVFTYYDKKEYVGTAQRFGLCVTPESYAAGLAGSRTVITQDEIKTLRDRGLLKGASEETAILVDNAGRVLNPGGLRFPEETARHKIMDFLGDISIAGFPLAADVYLFRTAHMDHAEFVKLLHSSLGNLDDSAVLTNYEGSRDNLQREMSAILESGKVPETQAGELEQACKKALQALAAGAADVPRRAQQPSAPVKPAVSHGVNDSALVARYSDYCEKNKAIFTDLLGRGRQDVLLRIPVEAVEAIGNDNIRNFVNAFQWNPDGSPTNGYVEFFLMSGNGDIDACVRKKFGLKEKPLSDTLKDFKKRTRANTVTLLPVFKEGELDQETIVARLGSTEMTLSRTVLAPIGLENDTVGLIRSSILGLKLMSIAREIASGERSITDAYKDRIQKAVLEDLKLIANYDDMQGLSAGDIIDLAVSDNVNSIVRALKKLIRLLPIAPIDAENMKKIFERARNIMTAA